MPPGLFWPLIVILTVLFILWALSWHEDNNGYQRPEQADWASVVAWIASAVFCVACLAAAGYVCYLLVEVFV